MLDSFNLYFTSQADSEADEVESAKARDPGTWGAWHDRYYSVIFRYALARTGRREDAEDLAAQTFLKALEGIDNYSYRGRPVLAWLYRICHNLVADDARRSERRPSVRLDEQTASSLPARDSQEPSVELLDAISRLRPEHAEVLTLRFLVALPARGVAELLGKSEAAVYSLQVRAIQSLRDALKD